MLLYGGWYKAKIGKRTSIPPLYLAFPVLLYSFSFFLDTLSLAYLNITTHNQLSLLSFIIVIYAKKATAQYQHQQINMTLFKIIGILLIISGVQG